MAGEANDGQVNMSELLRLLGERVPTRQDKTTAQLETETKGSS